jgi:hypothetical protein
MGMQRHHQVLDLTVETQNGVQEKACCCPLPLIPLIAYSRIPSALSTPSWACPVPTNRRFPPSLLVWQRSLIRCSLYTSMGMLAGRQALEPVVLPTVPPLKPKFESRSPAFGGETRLQWSGFAPLRTWQLTTLASATHFCAFTFWRLSYSLPS